MSSSLEQLNSKIEKLHECKASIRLWLNVHMKQLCKYRKPKEGDIIKTEHGQARILRILYYDDIIEEMKWSGTSREAIERFGFRVRYFLGNKSRYFECELIFSDGRVGRIDWSEYATLIKKAKGNSEILNIN